LFFSNKVDLSQERSVDILKEKITLKAESLNKQIQYVWLPGRPVWPGPSERHSPRQQPQVISVVVGRMAPVGKNIFYL